MKLPQTTAVGLCAVSALLLNLSATVQAAPIVMSFTADGFENAGTSYPGLNGPVSGMLGWDAASTADPITALTSATISIPGHTFGLADVGIANNAGTKTAIGALPRGANAVVGDGAYNDFLMVLDRVTPSIDAFAYSLEGKSGALWWTPATSAATYGSPLIHTLEFYLDGFENAGTLYAGYSGPVTGSLSWRSSSPFGRIEELLSFNLSLFGRPFGLADVGIANQSGDISGVGAKPRGTNAVVGDGAFDDFLMLINRNVPDVTTFAFSLAGKSSAIWWNPTVHRARYVIAAETPEPAALVLFVLALAALVFAQRRQISGRG